MVALREPPAAVRTMEGPANLMLERRIARRILRRLAGNPYFVASALAACEKTYGVDEGILAAYLGCSIRQLGRLALARRPYPHSPAFLPDTGRLATAIGVDGEMLALLLERPACCSRCAEAVRDRSAR